MLKLVLEKAEESEIKLPASAGSWKKQESSRENIYFCFIDYAKAFDCVDHKKPWKNQASMPQLLSPQVLEPMQNNQRVSTLQQLKLRATTRESVCCDETAT